MKKILLSLLLISGCSSSPVSHVPAPTFERLNAIKANINETSNLTEGEKLARLYLKAMSYENAGMQDKACDLFSDLADKKEFPLNQTALIHTLSVCKLDQTDLKKIWKKNTVSSYLKNAYLTASLKLAEKFNMEEAIARFSHEIAAFKSIKAEKIQLLKNSMTIAQRLGLSDLEALSAQKLIEISPSSAPEITRENIHAVAKDYESARQFQKAQDLYLEIVNGDYSLEDKVKAYNSYRISFKVARDLKTFLEKTGEMELYLRQLLDETPNDTKLQEAWVDAKINYARAVWTEHMNLEARLILDDILERNIGTPTQLATVYWVYGGLHNENKENKEALKKYEKASEFKVATLDFQETIQWSLVWNKYLLKKYVDLLIDVDRFVKKSSNTNFISKLNFWKAKALIKLDREQEAEELFTLTNLADPFGYYGLLSAMETGSPLPPLPPSEMTRETSGNIVLDWLIAMDEKEFSIGALKEINSQFKSIPEREKAMSLYARTGWYQGGMLQIFNFPMGRRDELTQKYISVIYPTPYEDIFSRNERKFLVPKAFIYAITRQESAFNPNVRSWADAFGLMQMIPEKAVELSRKYRIAYKDFNDLYRPELNVEMGAALVAELRKRYEGKFSQTAAAYNASTAAISVWEKERFNGDYLEFIEMIPYDETRNYIKLVFRNYIIYKRILGQKEFLIPRDFFEKPFN